MKQLMAEIRTERGWDLIRLHFMGYPGHRWWGWRDTQGNSVEVGGRSIGEAIMAADATWGRTGIEWPAEQSERREAAVRHALAARKRAA